MNSVTLRRPLLILFALLASLLASALLPGHAIADGDPGSDVLLLQNLFVDDSFPTAPQLQLGELLNATAAVGQPIRVAIISHSDDLGTVTQLWKRPQTYAEYLGYELSNTYSGRLLVVMPNGFGVYWAANPAGAKSMSHALGSLAVDGGSSQALTAATRSAVARIESAAGVAETTLANHLSATTPAGPKSVGVVSRTPQTRNRTNSNSAHTEKKAHPDALVIIVAVLFLIFYVALRRGWRPKIRLRITAKGIKGLKLKPVALLPSALLLVVVAALLVNHNDSSQVSLTGSTLATNPNLDQGTSLHGRIAPGFTLTDETGKHVSLKQYRGKVVILSFVDAECQTICPLTTQAMLDAKHALGAAGKDVQLLGVNVNWKSTQIEDVLNYTQLHGLSGQWHFLTGSLAQLQRVWKHYGVNEKALMDEDSNAIDHVAALDVIDPQGRLRTLYLTQSSYAAIPQFGQQLAREASSLLPSHPKVASDLSYAEVRGISPVAQVSLPRSGGGSVTLGPGKPHLYLFFATWDKQTTTIGPELSQLNAYERAARADGLPQLTAVDEGSVEPSAAALPAFLKTLPKAPDYPVAIDNTGKVADGYEVEGDPWFVLVSATGQISWYQEVYTAGWPSLTALEKEVKGALSRAPAVPTSEAAAQRELRGSPPALAALHAQAGQLLPDGAVGFYKRGLKLLGYPIVINIWATTCPACEAEFHLFSNASAIYGKQVAFLGADIDTPTLTADARAFLRSHQVSYPSYQFAQTLLGRILTGGLEGTPTTVYISPKGKVLFVHTGAYETQGALDLDIEDYALGGAN